MLKDTWQDKVNGVSDILAEDINSIAHSVMKVEALPLEKGTGESSVQQVGSFAVGKGSAALGIRTHTAGSGSLSAGADNHTLGLGSFAAGQCNKVSGVGSMAGGENNTVLSKASAAQGLYCTSGLKGFYWSAIDVSNKTITLSTVNGSYGTEQEFDISEYWAVGDVISIHSNNKYDKCSKITAISGKTITVDALPFTSPTSESGHITDNAVYVASKPDKGLCDFGQYAIALGEKCNAVNYASFAAGRQNEAYGQYSFTVGRQNTANYGSFVAGGRYNNASGTYSYAEGLYNEASGYISHAEGRENIASGDKSHAEGGNNEASGNNSHAEGENNKATFFAAHAEGARNTASGAASHAGGADTVASGTASMTTGSRNTASGHSSFASGADNKAIGAQSAVFGQYNTANGAYGFACGTNNTVAWAAMAMGNGCTANGDDSFAGGYKCTANGNYNLVFGGNLKSSAVSGQTVVGKWNEQNTNALFQVGNGTSDTARSNAFEVLNDGSARLGEKAVATEEYVDGVKSELSADISTVESIAKGANQAVAFGTYFEMIDELHAASQDSYRVGQNFYIKTFDVPDLWVRGVFSSYTHCDYVMNEEIVEQLNTYGVIVVGHYSLSPLETQKVDLTEYPTISEMQSYVNEAILGGTW